MTTTVQSTAVNVNVLPIVGQATQIYFTVIDSTNALTQATITSLRVLYGNAIISVITGQFIPSDNNPLAILVSATWTDSNTYINILYTKAILPQLNFANSSTPTNTTNINYTRLVQKIPLGIFNAINNNTLIGQILLSKSQMINDYYTYYNNVANQVYSDVYSSQLEYEYNGTVGLLSNSSYPNQLFHLLASLNIVALNVYDLELFLTKYIYYRIGTSCAVYINDGIHSLAGYWLLAVSGSGELGVHTVLAPDNLSPNVQNIVWNIYNSASFTNNFKKEIANLIIRIGRADLLNVALFNTKSDPTVDGFSSVGATYFGDPRIAFDLSLQYLGDSSYPLNIIGYGTLS